MVVNISTGGFESMRHDLEIPARYGIRQSVGDTVGPGGISRALRNIPVFVDIARDMEAVCPDAWMLNLTNPMTTICRAVTRSSTIQTIGLCHEVTLAQFILSLLLDRSFLEITATIAGVNHLPVITNLDVGGEDGFGLLRDLLDHESERAGEPLSTEFAAGLGHEKVSEGGEWTQAATCCTRTGSSWSCSAASGCSPQPATATSSSSSRGFLTEESGWGERWGVKLTTIEERETGGPASTSTSSTSSSRPTRSTTCPSGEMVAPVIMCHELDQPGWFPLNIPNRGQVADLPDDVVVERMCRRRRQGRARPRRGSGPDCAGRAHSAGCRHGAGADRRGGAHR